MGANAAAVSALLDTAKTIAADTSMSMKSYATTAAAVMSKFSLDPLENVWPTIPALELQTVELPDYVPPSIMSAARPGAPVTAPITTPTISDPIAFTTAAPTYSAPPLPTSKAPAAPSGTAPDFHMPIVPTAPTLTLPDVPTFNQLDLPSAPLVDIPTFDATLSIDLITAPTETFSFIERPYNDALLDELKVKLMRDLVNGGYGIETTDEEGLWERARERELRNAETMIQEVSRQAAARGFMLPPGALSAQIAAAQSAAAEKNSSVSREIALKRADMYVENRKFTIAQVKETEQMLITYWGYMQERSLNVAKAVVDYGIKLFEARVAQANFKLEKFKVEAQVYETELKAALSHLEAYKIQMEGARVAVEVQRVQTDVYRAQLSGIEAMVSIYRSQLDGTRILADMEMLRLNAFKASIENYATQVQARTAEFGMYESQVRGAMAPLEVFKAQVGAYATQIEAYKGVVAAAQAKLAAQIEPARLKVEQYRNDISMYVADIQAVSSLTQSAVTQYEAKTKTLEAQAGLNAKFQSANVDSKKAQADLSIAAAKQAGDFVLARGNQLIAMAHATGSIDQGLTAAFGSVGSAAMGVASGITVDPGT